MIYGESDKPVFIIGAPRSGTNLLRDILTSFKGFATWPCDEINYIWKYTNHTYPYDDLIPLDINIKSKKYIYNQFSLIMKHHSVHDNHFQGTLSIAEKTCANCLRIPFLSTLFPKAKFLYIKRDIHTVIPSAIKRWKASLDLSYLSAKIKYVPKSSIPYYGYKYLFNRVNKLIRKDNALSTWGPRFRSIDYFRENSSLEETCIAQYLACTLNAEKQLNFFKDNKHIIHFLNYEDLVSSPINVIKALLNKLGVEFNYNDLINSTKIIHKNSLRPKVNLAYSKIYNVQNVLKKNLII